MSAPGVAHPPQSPADMDAWMLSIKQQVIMEMLSTFFTYAAMHWNIESFNYLPITFLLVMFAVTCKHSDPDIIFGVNPQSCFEAIFGSIVRRSPDWAFFSFLKSMCIPRLGFLWEEKRLNLDPFSCDMSAEEVRAAVQTAATNCVKSNLTQLREQALCAFFQYDGDVLHAFLNYRDCFFLFKFCCPSNWEVIKAKYEKLYPRQANGKRPAMKFDKEDLPKPWIVYYAQFLWSLDKLSFSPVFLNALKIATSTLGTLENQLPLFQIPPGTSEEDLKQPDLDSLQTKLDEWIKNQDAEPSEDSMSESANSSDPKDKNYAPTTRVADPVDRSPRTRTQHKQQEQQEFSILNSDDVPDAMSTPKPQRHVHFTAASETNTRNAVSQDVDPADTTNIDGDGTAPPDDARASVPGDDTSAEAHNPSDPGPSNNQQPPKPSGTPKSSSITEATQTTVAPRAKARKNNALSGSVAPPPSGLSTGNNSSLSVAMPNGAITRSRATKLRNDAAQSQHADAVPADVETGGPARPKASRKRPQAQLGDKQDGDGTAGPSRSSKRQKAPDRLQTARDSDNAPGPSKVQKRATPARGAASRSRGTTSKRGRKKTDEL